MDANALRKLGDFLRDKEPKIVGVLASVKDAKVTLLAVCGKEAVASGIKAGDIIKAIAPFAAQRRRAARLCHGRRHRSQQGRRRARGGG